MRIGIDLGCWLNERGYGRFTRELLRTLLPQASDHEVVCFADPWTHERFDLGGPGVEVRRVEQSAAPARAAGADGSRSLFDMLALSRAVGRERLDVFLFPSVYTFFPLPPGLPAVVVVHDAIAERFPRLTLPSWRARLFWRAKVRLALWQSTLVLTVSDYSAGELNEVLGVDPERLRVTLEAPASVFEPSTSRREIEAAASDVGLPPGASWFIYVGGFNPHKNVDKLVAAHAELARELGDGVPYLLLVGPLTSDVFHQGVADVRRTLGQAGTGDLVRWTGYLPDATLRHLYSGSLGLVLPSASEGFGLPAIEAAACGAPVVATTASPLPDLLEGGGLFVAPGDRAALAAALRRLTLDREGGRRLGREARRRAARLSWQRSAAVVLEALEEAASARYKAR